MNKAIRFGLAGAMLACVAATVAAKEPAPLVVRMAWTISVDDQGHIVRLSTRETKLADIRDRIEHEIRSWQFSPGKVDGVPAPSDSTLVVTLMATPTDDAHYAVRVTGAATGGGYGVMTPPQYPHASLLSHRQGYVVLNVNYGADGKVVDAAPADGAPKADSPFVNASIAAVRQWVFVPEVIGGHPRAGAAIVPICFAIASKYARPPDCTWKRPGDDLKVSGDQMVALDSAVTLKSDVAGRAL